ncbi:enoyl-CoA hydratase/isomerase family protein [Alcaligenes sp. 13f]|uniref:enoyl-CoA hydratase/isomerase family protein n=1 Tax=Alcaligenes sp. 13f TaxID=2841924 RepID=UPI001CF6B4AD|nr:enoyl-CoA hydratase/isomerase family protein [Alcaligenes sp. 13f]MCB4321564.1 enoyl-CoA hydratase/isomerase family protein [Alcaligenes sp. 13f]
MNDDCILLRDFSTVCGQRFGHATLNTPQSLNALSIHMIDLLASKLEVWEGDPSIIGVLIDSSLEKAFCAGGDIQALYQAMKVTPEGVAPQQAKEFFEREYRLDYRIHTYPKPILCLGQGIVMGGGVGLMAGASHRIVTPTTRMAMPEITIGLYPDVGGSWFLRRMPGQVGLFLALTGVPLNAADACFVKLADFIIDDSSSRRLLQKIIDTCWETPDQLGNATNRERLGCLLQGMGASSIVPESPLRTHYDRINSLIGYNNLETIASRLAALAGSSDPWLATAGKNFLYGAPSSARLSWELWQKTKHFSLAEVFRIEYDVSVAATVYRDFAEGVRAMLIDKDRNPRWSHTSIGEVNEVDIANHFISRSTGPHPLSDLGKS